MSWLCGAHCTLGMEFGAQMIRAAIGATAHSFGRLVTRQPKHTLHTRRRNIKLDDKFSRVTASERVGSFGTRQPRGDKRRDLPMITARLDRHHLPVSDSHMVFMTIIVVDR